MKQDRSIKVKEMEINIKKIIKKESNLIMMNY